VRVVSALAMLEEMTSIRSRCAVKPDALISNPFNLIISSPRHR